MKVILCSSNTSVRERWDAIMEKNNHELFHTASVPALISLISQKDADLVLLHNLCTTPETLRELIGMFPTCKFMLLTNQHDDSEGIAYLRAGVVGYASTYIQPERLMQAIKIIFEGGVWIGQQLMQKMIADRHAASIETDSSGTTDLKELTDRENEVAQLIAQGISNKAIARKLDITERTVKAHLNTIYRKTHIKGRLQLALKMRK